MTYSAFLEKIQKLVDLELPEGWISKYRKIKKLNGVEHTGLTISVNGDGVSPVVYMEPLYEFFCDGRSIASLASEVAEVLRSPVPEVLAGNEFKTREYLLSHVIFRLISGKENPKLLEKLVHRDFLDMALTYGMVVNTSETERGFLPVDKKSIEKWALSEADLYEAAKKNAPKLSGSQMMTIHEALGDVPPEDPSVYVLSNSRFFYGASAMIYSGQVEALSESWKSDICIIPSSVHEVILARKTPEMDMSEFSDMIYDLAHQQAKEEERLSDRFYIYSYAEKTYQVV